MESCSKDTDFVKNNCLGLIENCGTDLNLPPSDKEKKRSKIGRRKSKKKREIDVDDSFVTNIANEESIKTEVEAANDSTLPIETLDQSDNLVFRMLLRGPRYFDPPDASRGNCYNCGEQGHTTGECTAERRKKACYYCGSTEHSFKKCTKGHNCYICKTEGHKAKDCPQRNTSLTNGICHDKICLKCGDSGHDMFSCKNNYFPEDLMSIKCYVCNSFGHICCYNSTDHISNEVSCFKCGNLGHTGLACARLAGETTGMRSPSVCYNCGEGGHFARECLRPRKACNKSRREMVDHPTSSCHSCGKEGHFVRDCPSSLKAPLKLQGDFHGGNICRNCGGEGHFARECPVMTARNSDSEMPFRNKKIRYDEDWMATSSEPPRQRGDWSTEHHTDSHMPEKKSSSSRKKGRWTADYPTESPLPFRKYKNGIAYPATPASWKHQTSGSKSHNNNYSNQSGASEFHGSTSQSYLQRFPASRFYKYSDNSGVKLKATTGGKT